MLRRKSLLTLASLYSCWCYTVTVQAFPVTPLRQRSSSKHVRNHRLYSSNNNNNNNNNEQEAAGELTNTLANLDKQWKILQKTRKTSRWNTLKLESLQITNNEDAPEQLYNAPQNDEIVYLLEPPNQSVPSCIITFIGGAGLGSYPQIAYNELLLRISDRLNAACIAAPYNVGLDHFTLAKETGERARRAVEYCQENSAFLYPPHVPVYALSHSLGGKLTVIHTAATNQEYAGIGMISFNNFGFGRTIGMAKDFADVIRNNLQGGSPAFGNEVFNALFEFAESAVSAIGLDFSPTPQQMERLISLKYDEEKQEKTRMFTFDEDMLQSTLEFVDACAGIGADVSELKGTHLTPVYFELGLDQIPDVEIRNQAREAMGGLERASYGNEEELNDLVDEICSWVLGNPPSKRPVWQSEPARMAAAKDDS